jgi:GAF domain-containing protein
MISQSECDRIVQSLKSAAYSGAAFRKFAMELLDALPGYDWSGIYRLEGDELILDEYFGAETDHTHIPVGRGVCGTAVAENRNQVVEDVRELTNYLACSTQTRSEIVVLIRQADSILGQIDIDSHTTSAFDATDEALLEQIAKLLAERW